MVTVDTTENENLEIRLLLEAMYVKYGYDFRGYSQASIKRRIRRRLEASGLKSISEMQHRVLYDVDFFETLLLDLSINVTEMFRDPAFFRTLREKVLPVLGDRPFLKIWHAGCASGEEVYSMAILLRETGIGDRARIYATDFNEIVLRHAKEGIFPADRIRNYTANYQKSGGTESFADYYDADYGSVIMDKSLRDNVLFADHNLVTDGVFGEMDLILCRNVLIYFSRELQNRVLQLFFDSLNDGGFLCIGAKESVQCADCADGFEPFAKEVKVFRKKDAGV